MELVSLLKKLQRASSPLPLRKDEVKRQLSMSQIAASHWKLTTNDCHIRVYGTLWNL